jgi:hypothetical protein
VLRKEEVILQPIESAADDIELRSEKLHETLNAPVIDTRNLQQLLQGMILAQVNGGTSQFCKAFLGPEARDQYPSTSVQTLRVALCAFLVAVDCGVDTYRGLCKTEADTALLREFELGFDNMKAEMEPMLKVADEKASKKKTDKKLEFRAIAMMVRGAASIKRRVLSSAELDGYDDRADTAGRHSIAPETKSATEAMVAP